MGDASGIEDLRLHFTYDTSVCTEDECLTHAEKCYDKFILPTIDAFIKAHDTEDLCLENLSVDLGKLSPEEIPKHLSEALEIQWQQHKVAISEKNVQPDVREQLITYLLYEQLPWTEDEHCFRPDVWWKENAAVLENDKEFLFSLYACCKENVFALKRLFYLVDAPFLHQLDQRMESLANVPQAFLSRKYAKWGNSVFHRMTKPKDLLSNHADIYDNNTCFSVVYNEQFEVENKKIEILSNSEESRKNTASEAEKENEADVKIKAGKCETATPFVLLEKPTKNGERKIFLSPAEYLQYEANFIQLSSPNHYFTDTAGIVLLHPFLIDFFRRLGFLDEQRHFISMEKNERAVHLLKYMSGYKGIHYGHCLSLEKLMCGLPPAFPVSPKFRIRKEEKQEVEQLLAAVCQHWKPLQGTSIAGLQQSFLQRQGVFVRDALSWVLSVETSGIDLLLDQLPWEISMLMLPWAEALCVSWTYES